jgi:Carboxypeptidase regulatory-like domain
MKHLVKFATLLLIFFSVSVPLALAQFSSAIEGTARDASGASISGAQVTITDARLGVTKATTTNQDGYFRFDSIASSTYTVQIQMSGFETWQQADLTLLVGETRTLAPVMQVGAVSTNVTVSAAATAVDLASAKTGAVIGEATLQGTPLTGQNVFGLAALTPGITGSAVTSGDNYTNEYSININAAGLRQEENGYMIDGAYTNTPSRGGGTSISPNPEIVQSMNIQTNDFDAQKGRNGGAFVEVFTNSGSNNLHGTIDYYFLNDSLSARTEFQTKVPAFQRNEVGGTIGGPAIKDKLFWYGAIDVLRSSVTNAYQATFETQDFDNWAQSNLPNNLATQILKQAPPLAFPTSNLQTVSQLEAATPGYYAPPAGIPAGLAAVGTSNISYSVPKNGYQWSFRVDAYLGKKDRIYVDAMRTDDTSESNIGRPGLTIPQANASDFVNVDWTHTFSSHFLNEMGANMIRPQGANQPDPSEAIPYINVNALAGFSNWGAGNFIQTTIGWRDVMTATVKTHTIKFGADIFNIRENDQQDSAFTRPTYNFDNLLDFIQDEATSEAGTHVDLTTHGQAPYVRRYRDLYTAFFVQDDWKIRPTLTLNAGLRYDSMGPLFQIISPSLTLLTLANSPTRQGQIAGAVTGAAPNGRSDVLDHNLWELSPRLGFSWDVRGDGKMALRGGFGLFSDQPPYLHITDAISGNLPYYYTPSINVRQGNPTPTFQPCSPPTGYTQVCPIVDTSNVTFDSRGGILINGVPQRSGLGGFVPDYKMTQVEAWTLSLQQQLTSSLVMEMNYSGTEAHHLPIYQNANRFAGDLIVNKGNPQYLNPSFAAIEYGTSNGNSIGNVGSALVTYRSSHGLMLRGTYSFAKALDVYSTAQSLDAGSITTVTNIIQPDNFAAQRGRADFDIHQQFSADGVWTVPSHYGNAIERNILGNWQFGGVWIMQTGLPFTVFTSAPFAPVFDANGNVEGNTGGDYNADGNNYDVPGTPLFGNHLSGQGKRKFLNGLFPASAFPAPPLGEEGNLGRNTYDQPGYNNLNFTVEKFFTTPWFTSERLKIQAKGEFFNLFNRVNLTGVTSDLSQGLFGHSTNQLPARSLQFHLRASF